MIFNRKTIENTTILRALVGSTTHGISIGNDDRDEMGVCIEPIEYAMGFPEFEQLIYRSAVEREGRHDARSQKGDLDLTIYSLRKFIRLSLKGNPTILILYFIKNPLYISFLGKELQELAPKIVSKKAGNAFLGYLTAQKQRMLGERGGTHGRLEEYDFKYAAHMVRLGLQGVELLQTGSLSIPMIKENQDYIKAVRHGDISIQNALSRTGELEKELKDLIDDSPLREKPDDEFAEKWMIETYWKFWKSDFGSKSNA